MDTDNSLYGSFCCVRWVTDATKAMCRVVYNGKVWYSYVWCKVCNGLVEGQYGRGGSSKVAEAAPRAVL